MCRLIFAACAAFVLAFGQVPASYADCNPCEGSDGGMIGGSSEGSNDNAHSSDPKPRHNGSQNHHQGGPRSHRNDGLAVSGKIEGWSDANAYAKGENVQMTTGAFGDLRLMLNQPDPEGKGTVAADVGALWASFSEGFTSDEDIFSGGAGAAEFKAMIKAKGRFPNITFGKKTNSDMGNHSGSTSGAAPN